MSRAKMFTAIFLAVYAVLNVCATTYYVNASRTDDSGLGTSWETAKKTIQAAINVAVAGDSIIVTNGLYAPIICYDKAITIQSVSGSETTIIDGGGSNRCAFLGYYSYQTNTVLNGFTLRNGCSSDEGGGSRGGSLVNCTLIGNTAVSGGATRYGVLYNCYLAENIATNGGATFGSILYGCKVEKNVSNRDGGGVLGGALTNCILNDNLALRQGGGSNNAQLYDCVISNNVAKIEGGGSAYGTLSNCTLSGNMAPSGGGSYLASLNNCILIDNTASRGGGSYDGKLNNCTISGNMASTAGGAYGATLTNCIVWANTAGVDANVSRCSLSYSCSFPLHPGVGNISLDPLLIDSNAGDLRLRTGSPCIDAGTNLPVVGSSDFAGNPRIQGGLIDMGAFEGGTTGNVITITQQGFGGLSHSSLCVEDGGNVSFTATEFGRDFLGFYTNGMFATAERTFIWKNITEDGSLVAVFAGLHVNASQPDDSGDGLAWATAMRSIQSAVDRSLPGDIIFVTNGVYSPVVAETKLIAIQSVNGADVTIIDGGNTSRCATLGKSSWPYKTSLNGFLLTNGKAPNGGGSSYGVLNHCILRSNSSFSSMGGGSYDGILNNCIISNNTAHSFGGGSAHGILNNCLVIANSALDEGGGSYGGTLNNCTLSGNFAKYGGGSSFGSLNNCIIWGNRGTSSSNNCFRSKVNYSCSDPAQTGIDNIGSNPMFMDIYAGDYRLRVGSPCIDAGSNEFVVNPYDIANGTRIQGDTVDMGAHEGGVPVSTVVVTFDSQGGTPPDFSFKYQTLGSVYGTLPMTTRIGHSLAGWWTDCGGAGQEVTGATLVTNSFTHTLYARWAANSYTVTFDSQNGSSPNPKIMSVTFGSRYGQLASSVKTWKRFGGWWIEKNGEGAQVTEETVVAITHPQTLYAYWLPDAFMAEAGNPIISIGDTNAVVAVYDDPDDESGHIVLGGIGQLEDGDMAGIEWDVIGPGVLSFDWKVSSEQGYDILSFYEDGIDTTNQISGTGESWSRVEMRVGGETNTVHTFRWEYSKDPIGDFVGEDCGWIDAITWSPAHELVVHSGTGDGMYVEGDVVDIFAGVPTGNWKFDQWRGDTNGLADVFSASTTLLMPANAVVLTATYIPSELQQLDVINGRGSGMYYENSQVRIIADPDPMYMEFAGWTGGDAFLLADDHAPSTSFIMPTHPVSLTATYRDSIARVSGSYGHVYAEFGAEGGISTDTDAESPSGTAAVKLGGTGVLPNNNFAAFETTVFGSGSATFWWRTSSEVNDYLRFLVDGVERSSISGTKIPWTWVSNRVENAEAYHTLRWEYAKDGSYASTADAGWVDDIVWIGDVPMPAITPDICTTANGGTQFKLSFWGERGIPYTVYSNATVGVTGWGPMDIEPQEVGETNGVFRYEATITPPAGQNSGFYRIKGGEKP